MPTFEATEPNRVGEPVIRSVWTGEIDAVLVSNAIEKEDTGEVGQIFELNCPDCSARMTLFLTAEPAPRIRVIRSVHAS